VIDPKINIPSKPTHSEQSESLTNAAIAREHSALRTRAYDLYVIRGRQDGRAEQDWYQAESDLRTSRQQA
jgi:hypothetical protein